MTGRAVPFDAAGFDPALEGSFVVDGVELDADDTVILHEKVTVRPAFVHLITHVRDYSPEWAATICDVPAATIRRVANEFVDHARVGETIDIEGVTLPLRPVSISLGKTVNNGWGGYECCWARTLIGCLFGALGGAGQHAWHDGQTQPAGRQSLVERHAGSRRLHAVSDESDQQEPNGSRVQPRAARTGRWCRWSPIRPGARRLARHISPG